ncbi:hypothetical protein Tco_0936138 [Tanacetum coccineum]
MKTLRDHWTLRSLLLHDQTSGSDFSRPLPPWSHVKLARHKISCDIPLLKLVPGNLAHTRVASTSNRCGKAKTSQPWTTTEEIALCKAWCEAMENYDTRDMKKGFWLEVFANFQKEMGGLFEDTIPSNHQCLLFHHFQLLLNEEALKETLEEEAKAAKELEERIKMLEEEARKEQAHDELFRFEFGVKSESD